MKQKKAPYMSNSRLLALAHELAIGILPAWNESAKNGTWQQVENKLALTAKDNKPRFSILVKGNGKLPFYCFSSMAVFDCPGAGDCLEWCYSTKAWRNPNAAGRQVSNSLLLRNADGRAHITREFLALPRGIDFRLYVDGDFMNLEILDFWMSLARLRPDISLYGYSKSWELFLSYDLRLKESGQAWPENYVLNLSGGSRYPDHMRQLMERLPIVRGEFLAVSVSHELMKSKVYQSKRHERRTEYVAAIKAVIPRAFVCPGACGDCLPNGKHACGQKSFRGVKIVIGTH